LEKDEKVWKPGCLEESRGGSPGNEVLVKSSERGFRMEGLEKVLSKKGRRET
jgi:hypothetical protein